MDENTSTTRVCGRCKGAGEYRGYGVCYGCQGKGTVVVKRTISEAAKAADRAEWAAIQAARAARKAERDVERAAR